MKLGHPSNKVLQILAFQFSYISFKFVDACDACALVKQKRLQYPTSNTKSSFFFQLIHIDIWAPFLQLQLMGINNF